MPSHPTQAMHEASAEPVLVFEGIEKSFHGVRVLHDIRFEVRAGTVVGIVGENGAGKSTLMNLVGGNLRPDAGRMRLLGKDYQPPGPRAAEAAGIGFVHQELNLFANLSIAENLLLTRLPMTGPLVNRAETRRKALALMGRVGLELPTDTLVENLSAGERQLVEIARTLRVGPRVLILDEPTTSLSRRESERLFALVRQLKEQGIAVLYISHALEDVLRLADDIVVLRDGHVVGQGPAGAFDVERLVALMVGRQLTQRYPSRRSQPGTEILLAVEGLNHPGVVRDVSFNLRQGEVLGIFGLLGAGRTELARILFGLDTCQRGRITLKGEPLRGRARQRVRKGMAFLTEDRRVDGLFHEASVADNVALVTLSRHLRPPLGLIDREAVRAEINRIREAVRLQTRLKNEQAARTLSGGNQQKVLLARWLLSEPAVLLLDEPTRGVDVGAKFEIHQLILDLADAGRGVIVISSELEELTGICDRILVLSRGRISGEFARGEYDPERLLHAALRDIR